MPTPSPSAPKPRNLTGDTPTTTGQHLGHFVGSLENRLALQDEYDCYFLIANIHAFTTLSAEPAQIRANTIGIVKDWLAVGLDPERSTFVLQSEIPAIAELTFLFSMLIPFKKVMRNPTIKTELADKFGMDMGELFAAGSDDGGKPGPSFGFPMYSVGQCADILTFRPELVPVGEDQEAHIEMCRDVASKFNQLYCGVGNRVEPADHAKAGGLFPIPRAKIGRVARLVGIDGVQKMSKSLGNAIFLYDDPKTVQKKINKITTGRQSPTEPGDPSNVLMQYVDAFVPRERAEEIKRRYAAGDNLGDGHVKQELGEAINRLLEPMRERRAKLDGPEGDARVQEVIRQGVVKANAIAEETLYLAKQATKLDFGQRRLGY
jgi:tryptophanyl-tRNA synthetase